MNSQPAATQSADTLALCGDQTAALAQLAFGQTSVLVDDSQGAALIDPFAVSGDEALDLDLADPQQSQFGDYTLLAKLGQGGMGVVYRAHQHSLDREVAIKLLAAGPWASPQFIERFRFEAHSAAHMQHPNIVTIYDAGAQDGLPFFSMRLVDGQSLAERLKQEGALAPRQAARLMKVVAEAVDYAHRLGVLHLDLKPANVLLDEQGEPMIADFGLARRLEQDVEDDSDEVSGTPSYMAPEQATLNQRLSEATDVYALGATLYECLTATPPFRARTARETLQQVVLEPPPALRVHRPETPLDLQAICLKCLSKDPALRYPSARALAEDLGRFLEGREVEALPLHAGQRALRLIRREPRLSGALALLLVALILGTLATAVQWQRAERNADDARENLWAVRSQASESALAEGDGFRGLRPLVSNLSEMEAAGRTELASVARRRIGTLLANAPQLIDVIRLDAGDSITSLAIAPDGCCFAAGIVQTDGTRSIRQYQADGGQALWESVTTGLTQGLPYAHNLPHGWLRYSADGRLLLAGVMQQSPFASPSHSDTVVLRSDNGRSLRPGDIEDGFADLIVSDDGRHSLVRRRSLPQLRFPDRVQLYRVSDGEALGPERHGADIHHAIDWMFTPDGQGLLGTADFVRFYLFDPLDFRVRWRVASPNDEQVRAWRFSPDSRWLALGTHHGSVMLIDALNGTFRQLTSPPVASVRWLEFSADSATLAALAEDGTLMSWDTFSAQARTSPIATGSQGLARVLVNGNQLWTAANSRISHWELTPPAPFEITAVPGTAQLLSRLIWWQHAFASHTPSGLLISGSSDGQISLWKQPAPALTGWRAAPLPDGRLRFDGRRLVAVDRNEVVLRSADSGQAVSPSIIHPEPVRYAELSSQGRFLVTVAGRTLRVLDPDSGRLRGQPWLLPATPLRIQSAERAQRLALTTSEYVGNTLHERIHLFDLEQSRPLEGQWRVPGNIDRFTLDPTGRRALVLAVTWPNVDNDPWLFDFEHDQTTCSRLPMAADRWVSDGAFSDEGSQLWLSSIGDDQQLELMLWNLRDCQTRPVRSVTSSRSLKQLHVRGDQLLLSALSGDEISIVDSAGRQREIPALPRREIMYEMAVSADGRRAAQATRNAVQIFDLERGTPLSARMSAAIAGNDAIAQLAFSADGERLLARTVRGNWLLWHLPLATDDADALAALANQLDPPAEATVNSATAEETEAEDYVRPWPGRRPIPPRGPSNDWPSTVVLKAAAGSDPDPRFLALDLTGLIDAPLNGAWPPNPGMGGDRPTLSPGWQRLNEVDWRVEGGIQLSGGSYGTYFRQQRSESGWLQFDPIPVSSVHVLMLQHVPHARTAPPRHLASVVVRNQQGKEFDLPIYLMRHVAQHAIPSALPGARIAWSGVHAAAVSTGDFSSSHTPSHLYHVELELPADAGRIIGLNLRVAEGPMESPLFYAVTLQRETAGSP